MVDVRQTDRQTYVDRWVDRQTDGDRQTMRETFTKRFSAFVLFKFERNEVHFVCMGAACLRETRFVSQRNRAKSKMHNSVCMAHMKHTVQLNSVSKFANTKCVKNSL